MTTVLQVLYVSRIAEGLTDRDIKSILQISRRNNRKLDVTGCLLMPRHYFAQVLEGDADDVGRLSACVSTDARHGDYRVVLDRLTSRQYKGWEMGMIQSEDLDDTLEQLLVGNATTALCDAMLIAMHPDSLFLPPEILPSDLCLTPGFE